MPEYIELNMNNYDEEQVSQLNEWATWAFQHIEELESDIKNLLHAN